MRKYIYVLLLLFSSMFVDAQNERLSVGFGGGVSLAAGDFKEWAKNAPNAYVNLLYNFNSRISTGLEGQISLFKPPQLEGYDYTHLDAILLKGVYFFKTPKFRPYAALMVGLYNNTFYFPTGYDGDSWNESIYTTSFGGGFLLGFNYQKLNIDFGYYNLGKINEKFENWGVVEKVNEKVAFFQIRIGFSFSFFKKKD